MAKSVPLSIFEDFTKLYINISLLFVFCRVFDLQFASLFSLTSKRRSRPSFLIASAIHAFRKPGTLFMMGASRWKTLLLSTLILVPCMQAATVKQDLTITWEKGSPNGQSRNMIFTNGQFPAPELWFNEGDDVEVC